MPIKQIILISIRALKTNKTRSILTMLGVIIGVASVILLVSLGNGLQKYITDQLEGIGSNLVMIMPGKLDLNKMSQGGGGAGSGFMSSKLEEKDAESLQKNSSFIKTAIPATAAQAAVKFEEHKMMAEIIGATANFYEVLNSPLTSGEYFTEADNRGGKKVAIIGADIASELFESDNPIGQKISLGENKFTVAAVLQNKGVGGSAMEDHVVIPLTTAKRIFNQTKVSVIYAQSSDADNVDLAIADAKMIILERLTEDDFTVLTQKEILGAVSSILGVLTAALAGIAAISLIVGGIGIMNIMLVSVTERTKEIGLRKALGATPNIILGQFLIEAIILSVGGGIIGIIIGGGGALALSKTIPTQITAQAVILAFGVSVIVGVIFGVLPARRASRLSPIDALRYE